MSRLIGTNRQERATMFNVGVIGLGMMGCTHLDVYSRHANVKVTAVSDLNPNRLSGREKAAGNIDGQAQGGFDLKGADVRRHPEGMDLIHDPNVQIVDICLWTPLHLDYAKAALAAGKHVLVEKPVARTYAQAQELAAAAEQARGLAMCAMCMRFWPGWTWLKDAVDQKTYGDVLAATFRRVAQHPGGPFYSDGEACGGALLDLHIHDTDFVQYLFGVPEAVSSAGYSSITSEADHVVTRYHYPDVPIVVAEGGWTMSPGFGFSMRYSVNFQGATAVFDLGAANPLMLYVPGQKPQAVSLPAGMGYEHEINYFLDCVQKNSPPRIVTIADAALSVCIAEAEQRSIQSGRIEPVCP
jgi:predicted dehydrogenase